MIHRARILHPLRSLTLGLALLVAGPRGLQAASGDILWSFPTGDVVYGSPAVDAAGNLYFGAEDGRFYSLTPQGTLRWRFDGATDWIDSSPALSGDGSTVYFGAWDHFVYAVSTASGTVRWQFETAGYIVASPALAADGTLYIGSSDGIFYAIGQDGNLRWTHVADAGIESSAVVDPDGNITFATTAGTVYQLSANGQLRWTFDASATADASAESSSVYAALSLDTGNRIYVGSRNHQLIVLNHDGTLAWTYESTDYMDSAPVLAPDGRVLVAGRDGYLVCLDPDGLFEWELLVGDVFYASPALAQDGTLYITAYAGNGSSVVRALDPDGGQLWSRTLPGFNDASITIGANGELLVGTHNGALYALEAGATLAPGPWPKFGRDAAQTRNLAAEAPGDPVLAAVPEAQAEGDGWYSAPWLAEGWFHAAHFPWINHLQHGWWWCGHASLATFWAFDIQLGWLYGSPMYPNLYYSHSRNAWLRHVPETSVYGDPPGRWFYDMSANEGSQGWFVLVPGQ